MTSVLFDVDSVTYPHEWLRIQFFSFSDFERFGLHHAWFERKPIPAQSHWISIYAAAVLVSYLGWSDTSTAEWFQQLRIQGSQLPFSD